MDGPGLSRFLRHFSPVQFFIGVHEVHFMFLFSLHKGSKRLSCSVVSYDIPGFFIEETRSVLKHPRQ